MRVLATTILLLAMTLPARSEQDLNSGNYMLKHCKHSVAVKGPYTVWDGWCAGAIDAIRYIGSALQYMKSCQPVGATNNQATMIVIKYLEQHPERLHENFNFLATEALSLAWPCK